MSLSKLSWALTFQPDNNSAVCDYSLSDGESDGAFAFRDAQTGFCIAGMWRGDNAPQLRRQLGLNDGADFLSILQAGWATWNRKLASHLEGPFALALFNPSTNQAYLARDGLGVEPLFWARGPAGICAASCPRIARAGAQLSSTPDPAMIADFVRGDISSATATFHKGLTRLAPGHWMLMDRKQKQCEPFWSLRSIEPANPQCDAAARFREIFAQEINVSGGQDEGLGVLLSGGLDSSAIAGLVADMRSDTRDVTTLSLTYEGNPGWVDRPYIEAMRDSLAMDHHSLPSGARDPFADMDDLLNALDGPSFGYGISVSTSLFAYAKAQGLKTVLHGHGGDEIVSYGVGRLNELAKEGQWRTLWRETEGAAALSRQSRLTVFERYLVHHPKWRWLKFKLKAISTKNAAKPTTIIAEGLPPPTPSSDPDPRPIASRPEHTERDIQLAALESPLQPHALETIMLTGRLYGLKIGMPFVSPVLAQFSVSLPADWKLRGGLTRYVLREAMRPFVPAIVANRRDKNDFTQDFIDGLIASPFARQYANPDNSALTQYFNRQWLVENWAKVEREGKNISVESARGLWRAAVLGRWLAMDRDAGILPPEQG
ncbi:MAG: asparagine synthase-related protein [Pseudomonadota bacterium]